MTLDDHHALAAAEGRVGDFALQLPPDLTRDEPRPTIEIDRDVVSREWALSCDPVCHLSGEFEGERGIPDQVGGDCDTGIATTHAAMVVADQTDALKQAFVDDWNANIAGKYPGAGQFSASTI